MFESTSVVDEERIKPGLHDSSKVSVLNKNFNIHLRPNNTAISVDIYIKSEYFSWRWLRP